MKIGVKVEDVKTVHELDIYWEIEDYKNLLKAFDYPDAEKLKDAEVLEFLFMAISDFEPAEAAEIVLTYKMSDKLNEGQIQNLSHEMLIEKVAEQYAEPALHFDLYNINQFLRKAYNGKFPDTEATIITASFDGIDLDSKMTKEILIKALCGGLNDGNLIHRLFEDQVKGEIAFTDAEKVIWNFKKTGEKSMEIITSKKWIEKEDFGQIDYTAEIEFFNEEE
ncbi:hypothetical protein ERX46_07340 [Brumimicrobium glaciale]|uniref:Uncharacterized protein n=1 Tax=Brumimicrobium glaciale TaxID=200475 RepID=A0A4Q4KMZ3_9FLAO|nr:hypothetical protein [Brumimicrobium glaciale]RYM33774.1 hypothetical protein ERX46_07340 [Brumimicrobium glaciale]